MVDIVQCYNPIEDVWSKTFCLPAALGGVRACTLTILPRLFNRQEYKPTTASSTGRNQQHIGQGDMQPAIRMDVDGKILFFIFIFVKAMTGYLEKFSPLMEKKAAPRFNQK